MERVQSGSCVQRTVAPYAELCDMARGAGWLHMLSLMREQNFAFFKPRFLVGA